MPATVPPGFDADGSQRLWLVLKADLANPAVVSAALLSGVNALDITCYLTAAFAPDATVATVTDDRVCLKQPLESPGATTWAIENIEYVYDVQNALSVSNELYAMAEEGADAYIISRYGMDVDTAPAAAQKVDVYPVKLGPRVKLPATRNTKGRVTQKPFVNGPRLEDVTLVA
jgi:hypothetical protein